MSRESTMKRAVKQRRAETQAKLEPILDKICAHEQELDSLRSQAQVLQAKLDSDDALLALEEQIRKEDQAGDDSKTAGAELDPEATR